MKYYYEISKENLWYRNYSELFDLEFVDRVIFFVIGLLID